MTNPSSIQRIAISTGGGDAPGLNAVIRAAVLSALNRGWEVYGIRDGYNGLLLPEQFPDGGLVRLTREKVRGITHLGGTIIGTTNRNSPLHYPITNEKGEIEYIDRTDELIRNFRIHHIDALITVGGDGSLAIGNVLAKKGLRVIGVPKTIDNDLDGTVVTFGFDTAVTFATECLDRLHSTAASHGRVIVVEVMGRYAGWIALHTGVAGSADAILIPEIPYDISKVAEKIKQRDQQGSNFTIVVVAEGAKPVGGAVSVVEKESGRAERLGGIGEKVAAEIQALTRKETRVVVLGHLLRGGSPIANDRLIALRFGAAAVRALDEGQAGVMVALDPPLVNYVPLEEATRRMKAVPLDCDTILTGRDLGVCFGD
ncbi:MAG TPA: ATP-dependent 6-phosphofructokinase [Anaerolineaceae bacterium]|mgnify:CR=1 FL=1|jgi:6-phosphofructokinase 1|nr:ATP-dependent 6-phosphofructokinase [Longilinea sp.]NMD30950.1 ATP-dependent 6-phosphofructokinase [Chloroflexota bacterium]HNS63085.1 ATP-dependent 6-phosphofructokinase [Anaerolineaceae bacterium]HNZ00329.1 ATP-dependent 6-phosphofructokinase [Anaerolineaceae bacterium]HOD45455.1 ATP-dependent 6-phosphofructokinase [Anaerolineaceae bacterium]